MSRIMAGRLAEPMCIDEFSLSIIIGFDILVM